MLAPVPRSWVSAGSCAHQGSTAVLAAAKPSAVKTGQVKTSSLRTARFHDLEPSVPGALCWAAEGEEPACSRAEVIAASCHRRWCVHRGCSHVRGRLSRSGRERWPGARPGGGGGGGAGVRSLPPPPCAYTDAETITVIIPTMVTVTVAEMPASSHRRLYFISSVFSKPLSFCMRRQM